MSITLLGPLATGGKQLPLYSSKVPAGFLPQRLTILKSTFP